MKIWQTAPDIMGPIYQLETSGNTAEPPSVKEILLVHTWAVHSIIV